MKFRPCIDIHNGLVKQIIGGSFNDDKDPIINFTSKRTAKWYAKKYAQDNLSGGHIIKIGLGNDLAAQEALSAWPNELQIGGGITAENASQWLNYGASKIIVTSYLFTDGEIDEIKLNKLIQEVGKENIVIDLSCRLKNNEYYVVTDRWQTFSETKVNENTLKEISNFTSEFLIHGVDVEGKKSGVEETLIKIIADHSPIQCVYAGGISTIDDIKKIRAIGKNRIDFTIGSALDLFGGTLSYDEIVHLSD